MKEGQRSVQAKNEEENKKRDPKYMSASFAASEQRKIDRQRAEAKKIQREREQEGDLYENTEAFVTDAYKQQMEEIRKAEEEEKMNEKYTRQKNKGAASFYKDMLSEQDRAHQAAVEASNSSKRGKDSEPKEEIIDDSESRRKARIQEATQKGLDVQINDENEVVDERSLLTAGLNTFSSQKKRQKMESDVERRRLPDSNYSDDYHHSRRRKLSEIHDVRQAQRERQSRMIEEQMLALQREREEEERKQEAEKKKAVIGQKRNDLSRIELARQRALERRKNKQEDQEAKE
jgi:coiled-coil domain-containing protein 55